MTTRFGEDLPNFLPLGGSTYLDADADTADAWTEAFARSATASAGVMYVNADGSIALAFANSAPRTGNTAGDAIYVGRTNAHWIEVPAGLGIWLRPLDNNVQLILRLYENDDG